MDKGRGSGGSPYVHSNANNFLSDVSDNIGETVVVKANIENSLKTLINIRDALEREAKAFLMGVDASTVDDKLLKLPDTYAGIATDIIQNNAVIGSLVASSSKGYVLKEQLGDILLKKEDKISQTVLKKMKTLGEQISVEKLASLMADSMKNSNNRLDIGVNGTVIKEFFNFDASLKDKIEKEYTDSYFNSLSSTKGQIVNVIKDLLLSSKIGNATNEADIVHSVDKFMKKFSDLFLSKTSEIMFWPIDYPPEVYLEALETELRSSLTKDIIDFRNAAGKTNEEVLAAVYKADHSVTLRLTATGEKTEEQIIKEFPSLHAMNTHHGGSKQSQTDMVIQNKEGMVVRAQSKTSTREFIIDIDDNPTVRILNHLQRSMNIYTLLNNLNRAGTFPIDNIDDICYAIANCLWFNTHMSVSGQRAVGYFDIKTAKRPDLLPQVVDSLNAALALQAPSFLGVSVEKVEKEIIADVKGSNIFYIENGNLIPTYIELDEIIRDLEVYIGKVKQAPRTLKFSLEKTTKTSWVYSDEEEFWLAKNAHGNYNSGPGYAQGAAAINSTSIHGNFLALVELDDYVLG